MKKKLLSLLIVLVFAIGMLPGAVMATVAESVAFFNAESDRQIGTIENQSNVYAKVSFTAPKDGTASIIAAKYDSKGALISAEVVATPVMTKDTAVECTTTDINVSGTDTLKIMGWDGFLSMTPVLKNPGILKGLDENSSFVKFEKAAEDLTFVTGTTVELGNVFKAADPLLLDIESEKVEVSVLPIEGSKALATYTENTEDWTKGTLSFEGSGDVAVSITDNYYCSPTTVTVTVKEPDAINKFVAKENLTFEHTVQGGTIEKTVGDIFATVENVTVKNEGIKVTVTDSEGVKTTLVENSEDWTKGTLSFRGAGAVVITITDNYFCKETMATVTITEPESADKFKAKDNLTFKHTIDDTVVTKTVGEIFTAIEGADIDSVNVTVMTNSEKAVYTKDAADWTKGTLKFDGEGEYVVTISDNNYCKTATATVTIKEPDPIDKFELKFKNTDKYLYRVGNQNTVALGSLFKAKDGADIGTVKVTISDENAKYTANSDWTKGTIQFAETGPVKVTIDDDKYCNKLTLNLEVVDAKNITSASSSIGGADVVLLNDVKVSNGGTALYYNCTVYGNGFTFDVHGGMNKYDSAQGHGIIIIKGATLDNLVIVGEVYDKYSVYTKDLTNNLVEDYTSAIDATNSTIQNCYIANCSAPVRSNGNTIINTTLYGGTVANLVISGGTNIIENVTTVNYNDGRGVIGGGILISDGASDNTRIVLNGKLKQYNFISQNDVEEINDTTAKAVFESMFADSFSAYQFVDDNGVKFVNTGIISSSQSINTDIITDNANTGYKALDDADITIAATIGTTKVNGALYSLPTSENSIDNSYLYESDSHVATVQGDYLPVPSFALGEQMLSKDSDDDTRYIIGDINGVEALYQTGDEPLTLDLTKLMTVSKYTNVTYPVSARCESVDGTELVAINGMVTLEDKGSYNLIFTVDDNVFYGNDGNPIDKTVTRTYIVPLTLDVADASVADATITISSNNLTGEYISSGSNKKYKMYPLQAISSIMDDANQDGTLENFNYKTNIQSFVLTPEGNNAFSSPSTITITYTGGQVLTFVLGTPSGLNSPGASNGGKTFSVGKDSTNGIYLQSDGAVASSSAATGTWPITSWSFKGTSGKTITNNTKVTINFTKPSSSDTCLAEGTLITLADRTQKEVQNLTGEEELLVWNLEKGSYDTAPIVFVDSEDTSEYEVVDLKFSDGSNVGVIYEHGFFDLDLGKYVYLRSENAKDYIGHRFVKQADVENNTWESVVLEDVVIENRTTKAYSPVTFEHLCYYTNGVLSMPGGIEGLFNIFEVDTEIMAYDTEKMLEDINNYGLFTYNDFADLIPEIAYEAFNGDILKVAIGKGMLTWEDIEYLAERYVPLV